MCEPAHSIVQYPLEDTQVQVVQAAIERPDTQLLVPKGIVIGSFINYSSMGYGHSEAIGRLPVYVRQRLPTDIKYESLWWERGVKLDSPCPMHLEDDSMESATIYAHRSSIGDLKILRRFLEASFQKSTRIDGYTYRIVDYLLSSTGREALRKAMIVAFGLRGWFAMETSIISFLQDSRSRQKMIGILLKMTRRRENLSSAWSDDQTLWVPERQVIAAI